MKRKTESVYKELLYHFLRFTLYVLRQIIIQSSKLLMSKVEIISLKENIVEKTGDILLGSSDISKNLAVFPNRRPGYFLNLYLYEKKGKPFPAPAVLSMDSFVDWAFEKLNGGETCKGANELDLTAFLYRDFADYSRKITGIKPENFSLDFFMPWARKIISDFEELKINGLKEAEIKDFDFLIKDFAEKESDWLKDLAGFRDKYSRFSALYGKFYEKCLSERIYTRAMKYEFLAGKLGELDFGEFENVVFAGFFALTGSEQKIFQRMHKLKNSFFLYYNSPLLEGKLPFAAKIPPCESRAEATEIHIGKTAGPHEEIMELKKALLKSAEKKGEKFSLDRESAVVLPDSHMILPLTENALYDFEKFNVSAGYPLEMTPVYSMAEALFALLDGAAGPGKNRYSAADYMAFVMHPYVKNVKTGVSASLNGSYAGPNSFEASAKKNGSSVTNNSYAGPNSFEASAKKNGSAEETRKIFQKLADEFSGRPFLKYAALEEIGKLAGGASLAPIHDRLIRPFENLSDIGDFARKLAGAIDYIAENSTAGLHPYWNYFPAIMSEKLGEVADSRLAGVSFENRSYYFSFIKSYMTGRAHPFRGSPVEGLQCLGFLESRNLKFENLFVLDVNDGIIPSLKKEDTVLPHYLREKLGLATYRTAREIYSYYFENLVFSAKKAHLFYVDDKNREASPFIEKIKWELEKGGGKIEEKSSMLRINFGKREPAPAKKTEEMKKYLGDMTFSFSSIDAYLNCQLAFYHRYILKLEERGSVTDEVEKKDIGILAHEILKRYFSLNLNGKSRPEGLEKEKKTLSELSSAVIKELAGEDLGIEDYIFKKQVSGRMADYLDFHFRTQAGTEVAACEEKCETALETALGPVKFKARIDRIDRRADGVFIVDYKTSAKAGNYLPSFRLSDADLAGDILEWGPAIGSLQLPLYIKAYSSLHKTKPEDMNASIIILGAREIAEKKLFDSGEERKLSGLFDKAAVLALEDILTTENFLPPEDEKNCKYCPYKTLCGRQWVKE